MLNPSSTGVSRPSVAPAPARFSAKDALLRFYNRTLIILLLYVLSTGPMYWRVYEAYNMGGSRFLASLYSPIALVCQIGWVGDWFDWYVGLWVS